MDNVAQLDGVANGLFLKSTTTCDLFNIETRNCFVQFYAK